MKLRKIVAWVMALMLAALTACVPAMAASDMKVKTTDSVHLRKGPGLDYAAITSVDGGNSYTYQGVSRYDGRGVVWHKISYKKSSAWVSSKYAKVTVGGTSLDNSTYVKTTASVNLRKGAGTGYGKVSTASKGTKLFYLGSSAKDSSGNTWYRVSCSKGVAWVCGRYAKLSTAKDTDSPKDGNTVVTTASVNMRKGPGLDYGKVTAFGKGKKLTYLGESKKDARGVTWYKCSSGKNTGWVSARYSKLSTEKDSGSSSGSSSGSTSGSTVVTTASVNMRKGPGLDYDQVTSFSKGKSLTYLGESQKDARGVTWYKCSSGKNTGWVSSRYSKLK